MQVLDFLEALADRCEHTGHNKDRHCASCNRWMDRLEGRYVARWATPSGLVVMQHWCESCARRNLG